MRNVSERLFRLKAVIPPHVSLIAVSKTQPVSLIQEAYNSGQRVFGENKVQELVEKYNVLPKDIEWHVIGHLQTNKVRYIVPFVSLIHSVDSFKLLKEINKQAAKINRRQDCLLQVYIATEETKFGLSFEEAEELLYSAEFKDMENVSVKGFMGMATNTNDEATIRKEFRSLSQFRQKMIRELKQDFPVLSMGMSSDYSIAIEEGSTMIRVGSSLFGERSLKN